MTENNELDDKWKLDREEHQSMNGLDRCDWCGKPIDTADGDSKRKAVPADFGNPQAGISREQAVDIIADAIEFGDDKQRQVFADTFREQQGYIVHAECYDDSPLSDMPRR